MNHTEYPLQDPNLSPQEENFGLQPEGEVPIITIERDGAPTPAAPPPTPRNRWVWPAVVAGGCLMLFALIVVCVMLYQSLFGMDIPVSATPEEHIARLKTPQPAVKPEVVKTTATVLGVTMNFYEVRGLRAELSYQEPTPEDSTVYLYSRSSDFSSYNPIENRYLGSIVMEGKELPSTTERIGFCAMANDNVIVGVARSERVKDYCQEQGGSFFRQFVLVSSGILPNNFYLHGKVERRALGTMNGGLYLVETTHPETLWSFADALREYGFTDAIYITGGADSAFYRDADGTAQPMGDTERYGQPYRGEGIVPWLVFKVKE